jgi:Cu/Ag efflux pump CusA
LRERLRRRGVTLPAAVLATILAEGAVRAVPPALLQATVNAAVSGTSSAPVAALVNGVLATMVRKRVNTAVLVLAAVALVVLAAGLGNFRTTPAVDAGPGPEQVDEPAIVVAEVLADYPGASAEEVERQVTLPLEVSFAGMPGLKRIGSTSAFGRATLLLQFGPGVEPARARQEVLDRLQAVGPLPPGVTPLLGPGDSRVLCRYVLVGPRDDQGRPVYTPVDLRALQDTVVELALRRVAGVVAVDGAGGTVKRYEVAIDPDRLRQFGITLAQIKAALANANFNVGGDYLVQGDVAVNVRSIGLIGSGLGPKAAKERKDAEKANASNVWELRQKQRLRRAKAAAAIIRKAEERRVREIRKLVLLSVNNREVLLEDIVEGGRLKPGDPVGVRGVVVSRKKTAREAAAYLRAGEARRLGLTRGWHDEEDAVGGVVWLRGGEDTLAVLRGVQAQLEGLNAPGGHLLPGVRVEVLTVAGAGPEQAEQPVFLDLHLPANVSLAEAATQAGKARALLARYPEVAAVLSQVGAAEAGEPAGAGECLILLNDSARWPSPPGRDRPRTRAELLADVGQALGRLLPGVDWSFSPVGRAEARAPFLAAPGRYGVKLFGPDLDRLQALAGRARQTLATVPGVEQVVSFRSVGLTNLEFRVSPDKCRHFGVSVNDVNNVVQTALGTKDFLVNTPEGQIVLRAPGARWRRGSKMSILDIPVDLINNTVLRSTGPGPAPSPRGSLAPSRAGSLTDTSNPSSGTPRLTLRKLVSPVGPFERARAALIYRENGERFVAVQFGVRGRDAAAVLAQAEKRIAEIVKKPERARWTGR